MTFKTRKKLIEIALPLAAINDAAQTENNIHIRQDGRHYCRVYSNPVYKSQERGLYGRKEQLGFARSDRTHLLQASCWYAARALTARQMQRVGNLSLS